MTLLDKADQLFVGKKEQYHFHIHPKNGWGNDPNGLVYFKGRYHVFFQCNPFENNNSQIFWAHVSSEDLIKWKWEPFALAPDKEYDKDGCFSGSAIVEKGKLYLFYTGHKKLETNYLETVCVAVSEDGICFDKIGNNPLISEPPENNTFRFRDPKVWKNNYFQLIIGGENKDGYGQVSFYESEHILGPWKYKETLIKASNHEGSMWECPDFFTIGNKQALITSPKGLETTYKNGFESVYLIQNFECPLKIDKRIETIDQGTDFYAPQTFFDPKKQRRILFGWFGLPGEQEKEVKNVQSGALTIPRELTWKYNKLYMAPADEMVWLRKMGSIKPVLNKQLITNHCELVLQGELNSVMLHLQDEKASFKVCYEKGDFSIEINDPIRNRESVM
ncbi:MAG: glycoside hydrolase family 32 protein, partial [Tetragenococcus koreensis]|nr:glycoside hydrolase family 32 protein [Tetragenococcus koreensis]